MMPGQTTTLTDDAEIGGGDSRAIRFTLLGPGPVRVNTRPQRQPTHSESGELGEVWLLRPGSSKPAAKAKTAFSLSAGSVGLTFQATDADAAIPGLWTCEVRNWTDDSGTWHTTIFGSIAPEPPEQLATVSFDVELLNLMLATVVNAANLQVHLESSEDGSELCHAQWSKAVSKKLGQDGYRFNLPPQSSEAYGIDWTFAIPGIDSMAGSARLVLKDGPPRLSATIVFPPNVTLKGVGHVSVDLRVYDLAAVAV